MALIIKWHIRDRHTAIADRVVNRAQFPIGELTSTANTTLTVVFGTFRTKTRYYAILSEDLNGVFEQVDIDLVWVIAAIANGIAL